MTTVAFLLVLASALSHATWNFLLKLSGHKVAFLWSFGTVAFGAFLVPAVVFAYVDGIGPRGVMFGAVSGLLHGFYGLALARSYQLGDLSTVYPISRGMGPALIPLGALLFLDEGISVVAGVGIALVVAGIYIVQSEARTPSDLVQPLRAFGRPANRVALLTGAFIAAYSLWDKASLDHLPPVTLNHFAMTGHMLILAPLALQGSAGPVRSEWRERRGSIVAAGVLAPMAYILILIALTTSRISYIAPAREVGIVLGAALGVFLLSEGYGTLRICGSILILAGVFTLGLAP